MQENQYHLQKDEFSILVVDDKRQNLLALENLLADQPCRTLTALSGQEALALLLDHNIFLILMDVQMPEMDGFETAELIRKNRRTRNIPIIFITAMGRDQDFIFKGYQSGAVDYLLKPINPTILNKKVKIFYALHQQKLKLAEKNAEMKRMFYIASHDLRSPLINIQGFSREVLSCFQQVEKILEETDLPEDTRARLSALLNQEIPKDMDYIIASVKAMDNLLKGLLKISRIGEMSINKQQLNVNQLIDQIRTNIQFQLQDKEIDLRLTALPACYGDSSLIHQVFTNLISNAIKYNNTEGEKFIEITGRENGNYVIYCITDNGDGISEADRDKVFDLFHRGVPAGSATGDGIGLTAVKLIIERHNGKVWLDSTPGKGTSFFLALPLQDAVL